MIKVIDLEDLDDATLARILANAKKLEGAPRHTVLAQRTAALVFFNSSLRTLSSMQAGFAQLGGSAFVITPGQGTWLLETKDGVVMDGDKAEHIKEAIPVLGEYADLLGVRAFADGKNLDEDLADGTMRAIAAASTKPFINLESAIAHPCQALADWKTLNDLDIPASREGKFVLSWVWHPRGLPFAVAASALKMAVRRGMDVTILRPDGYSLPEKVMSEAGALAQRYGARIRETDDLHEGMRGAHVLYAKSWSSVECYGKPEAEAKKRLGLKTWCVDEPWFETAAPNAAFMHCLPVRRNVKVTDRILDGRRSVVVRQAGNRLHAQKGLIWEMLAKGQSL